MKTYAVLVDDLHNDGNFAYGWAGLEEYDAADFDEAVKLRLLLQKERNEHLSFQRFARHNAIPKFQADRYIHNKPRPSIQYQPSFRPKNAPSNIPTL